MITTSPLEAIRATILDTCPVRLVSRPERDGRRTWTIAGFVVDEEAEALELMSMLLDAN